MHIGVDCLKLLGFLGEFRLSRLKWGVKFDTVKMKKPMKSAG